jgi:hypothetical protein
LGAIDPSLKHPILGFTSGRIVNESSQKLTETPVPIA